MSSSTTQTICTNFSMISSYKINHFLTTGRERQPHSFHGFRDWGQKLDKTKQKKIVTKPLTGKTK